MACLFVVPKSGGLITVTPNLRREVHQSVPSHGNV